MPIKEENKKLYPKNWKEIRAQILKRANNKCEFCGVPNYAVGYRTDLGGFVKADNDIEVYKSQGKKRIKIILTIAHLDHNPANCNPNNLRALCQKCHNNYDKEHRKETRKKTLEEKKRGKQA